MVQAPDHEVENARLVKKAGDDPRKLRRIVRKKPPEGFVNWTEKTFDRLSTGQPEPLTSKMRVSHAMLLNVIARPGDAFEAMRALLTDNHETPAARRRLIHEAIAIYRALLAGGVVEQLAAPDEHGRRIRLTIDLQADFALNQPLSSFGVATLEILDREDPGYPLDVVSVMEATLEDPRPIISAQRFKARGEAVAQMKADGIEYDERMELLEEVTHPQPLRDVLDAAYELYRRGHPWVADHPLRPKSVARDMWERSMTFVEYIGFYQLARSEGLVLRYLSDVYKALLHTVPEAARTDELTDITVWLGELVRQTDSSLLDEWEALAAGGDTASLAAAARTALTPQDGPPPLTSNARAFRVLVRNALFRRVELAALRRWDVLGELDDASGWDSTTWRDAMAGYFDEYDDVGIGANARSAAYLMIDEAGRGGGEHGPAGVDRPADLRRPGRAQGLGHRRRDRPRRLRRGGRGGRPDQLGGSRASHGGDLGPGRARRRCRAARGPGGRLPVVQRLNRAPRRRSARRRCARTPSTGPADPGQSVGGLRQHRARRSGAEVEVHPAAGVGTPRGRGRRRRSASPSTVKSNMVDE